VAGGTGVIGVPLVKKLAVFSDNILVVANSDIRNAKKILPKNVKYKKRDLRLLNDCILVTKNIDYVFNLVGIKGSTGIGETKVLDFFNSMIMFQTNLFRAAIKNKIKKFMFVSSICGYPYSIKAKKEDFFWHGLPRQNDKIPGLVKRIGELHIEAAHKQLNWKGGFIVRPSNIFGPHDDFNPKTAQVVPSLIYKLINAAETKKKRVKIWGNGKNIRDFVFSEDVADIIIRIMTIKRAINDPINIGTLKPVSIQSLACILRDIIDKTIFIEWDKSKPAGDLVRILNTKKLRNILPNFNQHSLKDSLVKTINWYKDHYNIYKH